MKINRVTITGADGKNTYSELLDLQKQYPFVEWGILFSKSKAGSNRYPTLEHMEEQFTGVLNLSAHFCGWYSKEVMENQNFDLITNLPKQFKRVQINYNFNNSEKWNLMDLMVYAMEHPERSIIFQYNENNANTLDVIIKGIREGYLLPPNIHFLHDASGGRGVKIQYAQEPFENYTGYSGGIDHENIGTICEQIFDSSNEKDVWIDMESGVRTNNEFDLEKVRVVLDVVKTFIEHKKGIIKQEELPIERYLEIVRTRMEFPEDYTFLAQKELICAFLEKILYMDCVVAERSTVLEDLSNDAKTIKSKIDLDSRIESAILVYHTNEPYVPADWATYHHKNCGTKYRGCDPYNCPKEIFESTGEWKPELLKNE